MKRCIPHCVSPRRAVVFVMSYSVGVAPPILSRVAHCFHQGTSECAAMVPPAATAGTPGPGNMLSPTHSRPSSGVLGEGTASLPARGGSVGRNYP